jgi:catechol 2,3-dioxygenase-like lactoylglutathione lyase family enzyme
MITALHALLYSEDPPATRAFFRDVLGWPYLEDTSSEPGWLIFRSGPSEIGVHPNSWTYGGESTTVPIHHEVSLMCDDLGATMIGLSAKAPSLRANQWIVGSACAPPFGYQRPVRYCSSTRATRPHTACSALGRRVSKTYTSAMSTETSMSDFFASVKITPLTGGTSP